MSESASSSLAVEALAEEFLQRRRQGEHPTVAEYTQRYPHLAEEIRAFFPVLGLVEDFKPHSADQTGSLGSVCIPGDEPGLERLGDYRILREVGRGGMGIVYEAEQESLGRRVALKVLSTQPLMNPTLLERFHREAHAAARLHHTNIVPVFGAGACAGRHYYVMQFIQGLGLDEVLEEVKRLHHSPQAAQPASTSTGEVAQLLSGTANLSTTRSSVQQYARSVARIGVQVAEALEYAHLQGTLHRDIKPSNLLLDAHGTVWVTDFGLAKVTAESDLTHTGDIVGTVRYMAPERFQGKCDACSDIYAVGLTLYELLARRPAFDAVDRSALMRQVMQAEPPRLRHIDPALPHDLETIVHKAIEKEPAHRYASAAALADDLRRFLEDRPIAARRVRVVERGWRWCRRNPLIASLMAAVVLLTLCGTIAIFAQWRIAVAHAVVAAQERDRASDLLFETLLREMRVTTQARKPGYREQVRRAIDQGLALKIPAPYRAAMRQEYVRCLGDCLSLPPLEVTDFPPGSAITSLATLTDAEVLAVGLSNGAVSLRHPGTGKEIALLHDQRFPGPVQVAADPRHSRFVVAHQDGTITLWEQDHRRIWKVTRAFATGMQRRRVASVTTQGFPVTTLTITADGKQVVLSRDLGTQRVLDAVSAARFTALLAAPGLGALHAAVAHRAASASMTVWNLDDGRPGPTFQVPGGSTGASVSPDGRLLVTLPTVPGSTRIPVWDMRTGKLVHDLPNPLGGQLWACTFSPNGTYLALAGHHGIAVYQTADFRLRGFVRGTVSHAIAFSPDSQQVAYLTHQENTVRLWDISRNTQTIEFPHPQVPVGVGFADHGQVLVTAGVHSLRIWRLAIAEEKRQLSAHRLQVPTVAFAPAGQLLASVGREGQALLWDAATGKKQAGAFGQSGFGETVAFHPNGRWLALGGGFGKNQILIHDLHSPGRSQRLEFQPHCGAPLFVAFSGDGRRLGAGGTGGWTVWDVTHPNDPDQPLHFSNQPVERYANRPVSRFTLSPNGRFVAWVPRGENLVRVREVGKPTQERSLGKVHVGDHTIAFFPDGNRLVFVTPDQRAEVWDVTTATRLASFDVRDPGRGTTSGLVLGLSRDGTWLAISSLSRRGINLFHIPTGQFRLALPEDRGIIWCLAWNDTGTLLAASRDNGTVDVWNIATVKERLAELGLEEAWRDDQ